MEMFIVELQHDKGKIKIAIAAENTEEAIKRIMKLERCPKRAVLSVRRKK